jgi:hypothetical protein
VWARLGANWAAGFEGLTTSSDGTMLYALLQSALVQDGGSDKSTERYTRLLAYSLSSSGKSKRKDKKSAATAPTLVAEYVVPLPTSGKGKAYASSELHALSNSTFLVLARDGNGHGDDSTQSAYKQADLLSVAGATNLAGSAADAAAGTVAPGGTLNKSVTPATYVPFVSLIDGTQLGRFAVHNGGDADQQLIDAKWESLALAPVEDKDFPDDYFLFTAVRVRAGTGVRGGLTGMAGGQRLYQHAGDRARAAVQRGHGRRQPVHGLARDAAERSSGEPEGAGEVRICTDACIYPGGFQSWR